MANGLPGPGWMLAATDKARGHTGSVGDASFSTICLQNHTARKYP